MVEDGLKIPEGHSSSQIEYKLTMPWPKNKDKQINNNTQDTT